MMNARSLLCALLLCCLGGLAAQAANEGQEDLDKATELQLKVESLNEVEQVIALAESALSKGLDEDNRAFAEQLLVGALWQHASQLSAAIFDQPRPHPRWPMVRELIQQDLEKIVKYDDTFTDAYLLRAKLEALPRGDREKGMQAVNRAIELLADDPAKRSEALLIRAGLRENEEQQLADLDQAIQADPGNAEAWQVRAAYHISRGNLEKAVEDFAKLLEQDDENVSIHQAMAEALVNLEKYELAMKHLERAMELAPDSALNYTLRARLHEQKEELDAAVNDLNQALKLAPGDPFALLARARLHYLNDNLDAARQDVDNVLQTQPGAVQAILLRSLIAAADRRFEDAINDLQMILREDPENAELQLQLATFLVADQRPRKAISVLNRLIDSDPDNAAALRTRADALLSIGKHKEAIDDYEKALKLEPEDDGILNNFAWVLATSPVDELRDADRAIELATKACEVTEYQRPHILSTLAAAYAEKGDFEKAIEWSTKAVELGEKDLQDQIEQLKQELESYRKGEPWREMQQVKEKLDPPARVIET